MALLAALVIFTVIARYCFSLSWKQLAEFNTTLISQGMEIPMMYMYGIMPVCGIICAICVVIKIITLYKADISYFAPKNQALSRDDA